MPFIPHTEGDTKAILDTLGVPSIASLFDEIPKGFLAPPLALPEG